MPASPFHGALTKATKTWEGYHLIWPRDLVETAGGFLAAGAIGDAVRVLHYLEVTQEVDGRWPQNMWLDGRPFWNGLQMDEAAFPILLVDLLRREGAGAVRDLKRCGQWCAAPQASSPATGR